MTEQHKPLRTFTGAEIKSALIEALESIDTTTTEIVTVKAGENMPITIAMVEMDSDNGFIPEYAWTGEGWREIGYL